VLYPKMYVSINQITDNGLGTFSNAPRPFRGCNKMTGNGQWRRSRYVRFRSINDRQPVKRRTGAIRLVDYVGGKNS